MVKHIHEPVAVGSVVRCTCQTSKSCELCGRAILQSDIVDVFRKTGP